MEVHSEYYSRVSLYKHPFFSTERLLVCGDSRVVPNQFGHWWCAFLPTFACSYEHSCTVVASKELLPSPCDCLACRASVSVPFNIASELWPLSHSLWSKARDFVHARLGLNRVMTPLRPECRGRTRTRTREGGMHTDMLQNLVMAACH